MSAITTKSLSFSYTDKPVLSDINLAFNAGEMCAVIGPNGAGKSTLLSLMQGIMMPAGGQVFLNEKNINEYSRLEVAKEIAVVSQFSNLIFPFTVMEVVLMGRHPYQGMFSFEDKDDIEIAEESLRSTHSDIFKNRYFNQLSGGEKQRVLIARALAQSTPILLLDEPTSSLDLKHQKFIFELLKNLVRKQKKNVVVVSHDINLASLYSDRLILLKDGMVVKDGLPEEILNRELLGRVYETDISIEPSNIGPPFVRILPDANNQDAL